MLLEKDEHLQAENRTSSKSLVKSFGNVVAFKLSEKKFLGFHVENMQVAELDPAIWNLIDQNSFVPNSNSTENEMWSEVVSWSEEKDPNVTDMHIKQKVRALSINVTQVCNLKCTYCAAGGDGTYGSKITKIDISKVTPQIDLLLKRLDDGDKFSINFIGGEPLIYPAAIQAMIEYTNELAAPRGIKVRYEMTTNGTLVSSTIAEMLGRFGVNVTVSLDGPAEMNDLVRPTAGGLGSTEKCLKGVAELFKVKEQLGSLSVHSVFGSHNTEVFNTYVFLQKFKWDVIFFTYATGPEDETYSPIYLRELLRTAEFAFKQGGERALRKISQFNDYFEILDSQKRMHNYCGAGKSVLQVDTQGKFYACNWFVGDKNEELGSGLKLDQEKISKYAEPLVKLNNCGDCWAKYLCGGGCMFVHRTKTQDKHKKDPEFCTRTRSIIQKGLEYYEESRQFENQGEPSEVY